MIRSPNSELCPLQKSSLDEYDLKDDDGDLPAKKYKSHVWHVVDVVVMLMIMVMMKIMLVMMTSIVTFSCLEDVLLLLLLMAGSAEPRQSSS